MTANNISANSKKRQILFDLFSKNLMVVKQHPRIKIEPDEDDIYICPVCMKFFRREELLTDLDLFLTLEDIPPKALGGNVKTLTCNNCNNDKGGSQLERDLRNMVNFEEAVEGLYNIPIRGKFLPTKDIELTSTIRFVGNNGIYVEGKPNKTNPKYVNHFNEIAESKTNLGEFSLTLFGDYTPFLAEVALLRIAYLLAFSTFGYGFLINFNLQLIREQINTPRKRILEHLAITKEDYPDEVLGINIITHPKELQSFLIVFDLKTSNRAKRYGVLLPGPSEPGLEIYKWLSLPENQRRFDFRYKHILDDEYLKKPELAFASDQIWYALK
jgi:hypothetical protein